MITTCNQFYNPQLNQRCDSKHFFAAIETAVSQEDVGRLNPSKLPRFDGSDCAEDWVIFRH